MTRYNSLPNDRFLNWSRSKAFARKKINVIEKIKLVIEWVEKIVGKRENGGYQLFLLFLLSQKAPYTGVLKVRIMW